LSRDRTFRGIELVTYFIHCAIKLLFEYLTKEENFFFKRFVDWNGIKKSKRQRRRRIVLCSAVMSFTSMNWPYRIDLLDRTVVMAPDIIDNVLGRTPKLFQIMEGNGRDAKREVHFPGNGSYDFR